MCNNRCCSAPLCSAPHQHRCFNHDDFNETKQASVRTTALLHTSVYSRGLLMCNTTQIYISMAFLTSKVLLGYCNMSLVFISQVCPPSSTRTSTPPPPRKNSVCKGKMFLQSTSLGALYGDHALALISKVHFLPFLSHTKQKKSIIYMISFFNSATVVPQMLQSCLLLGLGPDVAFCLVESIFIYSWFLALR